MSFTPSQKAENLQRRLARKYRNHPLDLLVVAWLDDSRDIVVKVMSDKAPALQGRDWFRHTLGGHDLYRLGVRMVEKAIDEEIQRELSHQEWLATCAAMTHYQP